MNRSSSVQRHFLGCFLALTVITIEVICGIGIALTYNFYFPGKIKYESRATILIEPKSFKSKLVDSEAGPEGDTSTIRHDKMIAAKDFMNEAIESGGCQLPETFRELNQSESVQKALEHLTAVFDKEEPNIYNLSFQADTPAESRVFLNSLIKAYQDYLDETYRSDEQNAFETIRREADKFVSEFKKLSREYDQILFEYADVFWGIGESQASLQSKLERMEKSISDSQKRLAQLKSDQKWIVEATDRKDNPLQLIGEVEKRAKATNIGITNSLDESSNKVLKSIAQEQLAKLEIKKQELMQRLGAGHPDVKAIDQRIEFFRQQAKNDNAETTDPDPQQINKQIRGYTLQLAREIRFLAAELEDDRKQLSKVQKAVARRQKGMSLLADKEKEIKLIHALSKKSQAKLAELDPDQLLSGLESQNSKGFRFEVLCLAEDGVVVRRSLYWPIGIGGFLGLLLGIATVFGFLSVRSRFQ